MAGPRIFDLSPPGLGAVWLTRLMEANGIRSCHHEGGALGRDIVWGALNGLPPCPDRPGIRFYAGLEAAEDLAIPPALGWRHFRYLRKTFPQAVFLLVLRACDDWIAARLQAKAGSDARNQALSRGCSLDALPQIWREEYTGLIRAARGHFRNDPRYVELGWDRLSPTLLREALAPWHMLSQSVPFSGNIAGAAAENPRLPPPAPYPAPKQVAPPLRGEEAGFVNRMAGFFLGNWQPNDGGTAHASQLYACFDGAEKVRRRDGRPWPIMRHPHLPGRPFIQPGHQGKAARTLGVLEEVRRLGRLMPLHLDMQDARWAGSGKRLAVGVPLLTYNRRQGTRNLTLWPLPGYHTLGLARFAHTRSPDPIPWEAKADRVAWRGDPSGQMRKPDGSIGRSARSVIDDLDRIGPDDEAGLAQIRQHLMTVPRIAAVMGLAGPDFDLAFTPGPHMRDLRDLPMLAPYCDRRRRMEWFYGFRYLLSLPGYDTGSNFIMAANSGSVVMKAEDGWEVFYSHLFRPWEHYIPLQVDASDAPARLDWARANPAACRDMVRAANAACVRLADTRLRVAALHLVLDGIAVRT